MGSKFARLMVSMIFFAGWVAAPAVLAAEFSADIVVTQDGQQMMGKTYVKDKMIRMEINQAGMSLVTITNLRDDVAWMLNSADKTYLEVADVADDMPNDDEALEKVATPKSLGEETVNGYRCEKVEYVFHDPSMGAMIQWKSKELEYPIKTRTDGPDGQIVTELKNIREGGVSDELFRIPAGYTKMDIPSIPGMPGVPGN